MTDLAPSPNPLPTTERTLQDDIRHDRAYLAGLRAGWNLGIVNANDEFNGKVNSLVSGLTAASSPTTEGVTQGCPVPDGWKLVPVEPDDNMICDGFECDEMTRVTDITMKTSEWPASCAECADLAAAVYRAMIAAAPLPPPPGQ